MRLSRPGMQIGAFLLALLVSAAATVILWPKGIFVFLAFPFLIPFGRRFGDEKVMPSPPTCPTCGWQAVTASDKFCPRHGDTLRGVGPGAPVNS